MKPSELHVRTLKFVIAHLKEVRCDVDDGAEADETWRQTMDQLIEWAVANTDLATAANMTFLAAHWRRGSLLNDREEEDLMVGRERLGSIWKAASGWDQSKQTVILTGWMFAGRSDISPREAPTRKAARDLLLQSLCLAVS